MRKLGKVIARGLGAVGVFALAACSPIQIGSRVLDFGGNAPAPTIPGQTGMIQAHPRALAAGRCRWRCCCR